MEKWEGAVEGGQGGVKMMRKGAYFFGVVGWHTSSIMGHESALDMDAGTFKQEAQVYLHHVPPPPQPQEGCVLLYVDAKPSVYLCLASPLLCQPNALGATCRPIGRCWRPICCPNKQQFGARHMHASSYRWGDARCLKARSLEVEREDKWQPQNILNVCFF